jgi:hypothetical protein
VHPNGGLQAPISIPRCTLTGVFGRVRGQAASILNPKALQCDKLRVKCRQEGRKKVKRKENKWKGRMEKVRGAG